MGVDNITVLNPSGTGRKSVRITSKKTWTHGLFIADIEHMPGGICGTWPACELFICSERREDMCADTVHVVWSFGPDWPDGGEIDIIEGMGS